MERKVRFRVTNSLYGAIKVKGVRLEGVFVKRLEKYVGKLPSRPYMVEYCLRQNGTWVVDSGGSPKFLSHEKGEFGFPCCILDDLGWDGKRVTRRIVKEEAPDGQGR